MWRRPERSDSRAGIVHAPVFAALGATPRLRILERLRPGQDRSITDLTHGSRLTRQAVSKHLRVLERAAVVRSVRRGREILFRLEPKALSRAGSYLDDISCQWDRALRHLKAYVENPRPRRATEGAPRV